MEAFCGILAIFFHKREVILADNDNRRGRGDSPRYTMNKIGQINDSFRKTILTNTVRNGRCILTQGVQALDPDTLMTILDQVRDYDTFAPENDPHGEDDFGVIEMAGVEKLYWKIDIYEDATLQWGSGDREKGYRVLTIMLASEN